MTKYDYPENFFEASQNLQKLSGVWIYPSNVNLIWKIAYFTFSKLIHFIGFLFVLLETIYYKETYKEISTFVGSTSIVLTHLVGVFKLYTISRHKIIEKIQATLQDERFFYETYDDGFSPGKMFCEAKRKFSILAYSVCSLYTMVGVLAHITMATNLERSVDSKIFENNETCHTYLPYFFFIPFPTNTKLMCHITMLFLDVAFDIWAWVIACGDILYVGMLYALSTNMKITGNVLKNLKSRTLKKLSPPPDNDRLNIELNSELNRCVKHLQILIKVRDDVESLYTFVILGQVLTSLFTFASCLYKASMTSMISPEFWAQIEYFFCVMIQFYMICYYGNELTTASRAIGQFVYESEWLGCDRKFKNSMLIILVRMQKPLYLTIGKFTPLNLATFLAVCKGSFSYFALFKSIK